MAQPSRPSGRPLELEDRRPRAAPAGPSKSPISVSPLALERWAIVLRRHRAGYAGYEHVDAGVLELARRSRLPDTSMLHSLMSRLRSLGRRGRGNPRPPRSA